MNLGTIGITLAVLGGVVGGLGLFTFDYGEGLSYFSRDPTACTNCHIMQPYYDSWQKASHHTLQNFHEPIQIIPRNARILQENCVACHEGMVHELIAGATTAEDAVTCVHCHSDVGHGPEK